MSHIIAVVAREKHLDFCDRILSALSSLLHEQNIQATLSRNLNMF